MKRLTLLISMILIIGCITVQAETIDMIIDQAITEAAKKADQQLGVDKYIQIMSEIKAELKKQSESAARETDEMFKKLK